MKFSSGDRSQWEHSASDSWKALLRAGLTEDGWQWDWTTLGALSSPKGKRSAPLRAQVIAKAPGVWGAASLVTALNALALEMGAPSELAKSKFEDGAKFKAGTVLCEWSGPARLVLALERPFLNLAQYICGIATQTDRLVSLVSRACPKRTPRVTSTRKTLPGYRDIAVMGVLAGGGHSHRVSLSGGVLIKENHIALAGGIAQAIEGARAISPHGLKIEVEVRSMRELNQALKARADGVLLDNFTPQQVREALALIDHAPGVVVEVSGGLNESNIADYALRGVEVLSSGSLTHSVKALDLSMIVRGVRKA